MTGIAIDREALRLVAQASAESSVDTWFDPHGDINLTSEDNGADVAFIAAARPDVVLDILSEQEQFEQQNQGLREKNNALLSLAVQMEAYCEAALKDAADERDFLGVETWRCNTNDCRTVIAQATDGASNWPLISLGDADQLTARLATLGGPQIEVSHANCAAGDDLQRTVADRDQTIASLEASLRQMSERLEQKQARIDELTAEALEKLDAYHREISLANQDRDDAKAERDELDDKLAEAERGPWPEWAEKCLRMVRKLSGNRGEDDYFEGVDLPGELEELLSLDEGQSQAVRDVLAERQRQISSEGWSPEHDDRHIDCELAAAAACYLLCNTVDQVSQLNYAGAQIWPGRWNFKPKGYRQNLVRGVSLGLAEIERYDRSLAAKKGGAA